MFSVCLSDNQEVGDTPGQACSRRGEDVPSGPACGWRYLLVSAVAEGTRYPSSSPGTVSLPLSPNTGLAMLRVVHLLPPNRRTFLYFF